MIPIWIWFAIRSCHLFYFCHANPGIEFGGFFQYSKYRILKQLPKKYIPKTILVTNYKNLYNRKKKLLFPIVVKPDMGERGKGVELLKSAQELNRFFKDKNEDYIIQNYIPHKIELGVFYHRFPNESKGIITSITKKSFLSIVGDGKKTFQELIENLPRAQNRLDFFKRKYSHLLDSVLKCGESFIIEKIGNHNRGTTFYNGNYLISDEIIPFFDKLADSIGGFNYGRFDIKLNSTEDLNDGNNVKVMEVNGANSEVTHIYHPNYSIIKAYKEIIAHLTIQYRIAKANIKQGAKRQSHREFIKALINYLIGKPYKPSCIEETNF